jgi:signal transduction histidine kinase
LKEVDPSKLIREAVENAGKLNKGKSIRLSASLEELPKRSVLDPVLIYQAFFNILMNAYQHTSDGDSIDIHGRTDGALMSISVRDSGKGISEDVLPYVFDPFFSTRKEDGGNGLGLAITKKIVERHRGSILVRSDMGEQTVFQITLPVQADRP